MATVTFANVGKTYPDGTRAVIDLNLEIEGIHRGRRRTGVDPRCLNEANVGHHSTSR